MKILSLFLLVAALCAEVAPDPLRVITVSEDPLLQIFVTADYAAAEYTGGRIARPMRGLSALPEHVIAEYARREGEESLVVGTTPWSVAIVRSEDSRRLLFTDNVDAAAFSFRDGRYVAGGSSTVEIDLPVDE